VNQEVKPIPKCPKCQQEMKRTGRKNRGDKPPVSVFSCMNTECFNRRRYNRQGQEIW